MAINAVETRQGARALAEIESDLFKAEAAFADADKRLAEAERDRSAAVDTINQHQTEFDIAVSGLRLRSTAGSKWRLEMGQPEAAPPLQGDSAREDALVLRDEAQADDDLSGDGLAEDGEPAEETAGRTAASHRSNPISVSEEFDRLKMLVQTVGNDTGQTDVRKQSTH